MLRRFGGPQKRRPAGVVPSLCVVCVAIFRQRGVPRMHQSRARCPCGSYLWGLAPEGDVFASPKETAGTQ